MFDVLFRRLLFVFVRWCGSVCVCALLTAVRCLLFVDLCFLRVYCLFVVRCVLLVDGCSLFGVCCLLFVTARCSLFVVRRLFFVVC